MASRCRRLVMLGSPQVAVVAARALVEAGHDIVAVVSRADARRGRGTTFTPTPLKAWAMDRGVPVFDDPDAAADAFAGEDLLGIVVAFGRVLKPRTLARIPMLNIHFSLLPRWRGAAPVERALLAGDAETGVCIMHVEEGLDTGAVVASWRTPISGADTTSSLTERLADAGARLLVEVLAGEIGPGVPQEGSGTHAAKITSDERIIDWSRSAVDIDRLVRALRPSTNMGDRSVKVIAARPDVGEGAGPPGTLTREGAVTCGSGVLVLETVQPSGRSPMPAADWIAGLRWSPGLVLGSLP